MLNMEMGSYTLEQSTRLGSGFVLTRVAQVFLEFAL